MRPECCMSVSWTVVCLIVCRWLAGSQSRLSCCEKVLYAVEASGLLSSQPGIAHRITPKSPDDIKVLVACELFKLSGCAFKDWHYAVAAVSTHSLLLLVRLVRCVQGMCDRRDKVDRKHAHQNNLDKLSCCNRRKSGWLRNLGVDNSRRLV